MGKFTMEPSPDQSVATLLVSVEDLINMAMGPEDKNVVNYKLIQTVLHILARQMRLLEQRVEIRVTEYANYKEKAPKDDKEGERSSRERYSRERSSRERPSRERYSGERYSHEPSKSKERSKSGEKTKAEKAEAKETEKQFRTAEKERRNIERVLQKEKERAEREKAEREQAKEERTADRAISKEGEKSEKAAAKDRDRDDRATSKDREKTDKAADKEREREERRLSKDRERAEKSAAKERDRDERGASKDREKADKAAAKEREREERGASKERDKADKAAEKEREREERGASKERDKADKAAAKEREREERGASKERDKADKAAEKEREREERGASKERDKADKAAAKEREREERGASKEREKADKAAAKEREREERGASKEREKADKEPAKEREREEKGASKEREKADKAAVKEREREERGASKDRERAEKSEAKDREREEKAAAKADRDASKDRERAEKAAAKDKEREEKASSKADRDASKERERSEKAAAKDREREEKAATKADKEASRDRDREERASAKADKAASKERDRDERAAAKDERVSPKEREKAEKAAAKEERATEKEREKEPREAAKAEKYETKDKAKTEKEMTKAEKAAAKDREQEYTEKEQEKAGREQETKAGAKGKKGKGADTGIAVKEEARDKEKVLVVEKGPTTRSGASGPRSNIEVVTRSQFDLLKDIVGDLAEKAGPLPMPSMPQNKELLQRLSKGTASLTDMMDAMQVSARVVAAEQAIGRMGGILTQLATAGALPEDIAGQVGEVTTELEAELQEADVRAQEAAEARAEARAEAQGGEQPGLGGGAASGGKPKPRVSMSRKSIISTKGRASAVGPSMSARPSMAASMASGSSSIKGVAKVTHPELDDAVRQLKEDLNKNMAHITSKSTALAENSMSMVKSVVDKLEMALKVNSRISTLHAMVTDYAEQLSGFDAGLTTQMQSFAEQIAQMRGDLGAGLKLLESVNNNAETAAVMELTERYEGLVTELDNTLRAHSSLDITQVHLGEDLRSLLEAVEMLREQKADRDEVQDGLRDKADTSRLAGLLTEMEFYKSRAELERRLAVCHEKFHKQDSVWMDAVKDLKEIIEVKADLVHLLGTREEVQRTLETLHEMCKNLALVLGEPKAALLTRELTRGSQCGACLVPALMSPWDARAGAPPRLPAARPRPTGAPAEPCEQEFQLPAPPDTREHMCNRWVGGSHTLITDAVRRLHAEPPACSVVPTNRYTGYGEDGKAYLMEEELQPCLECNKLSNDAEGAPAEGHLNVINVNAT